MHTGIETDQTLSAFSLVAWNRTHGDIPDFGVAHKAIVQAHIEAVSSDVAYVAILPQRIHIFGAASQNSVPLLHI